MEKLRAAIIGCGRIGVGFNWPPTPFPYTHADAYKALADRVELVALCEPDEERARWAQAKHRVEMVANDLDMVLSKMKPDIVSVCVDEASQWSVMQMLAGRGLKGIWVEKPYMAPARAIGQENIYEPKCPIQVNYIRRFDTRHQLFAKRDLTEPELIVIGRPDLTTACHFVDLCRFWKIPLEQLHWTPNSGPCSYLLRFREQGTGSKPSSWDHREVYFPDGGVSGGFMKAALSNLLDAVEGKHELVSPADPSITDDTRSVLDRLGHPR